jgi:hypothetical protein
MTDIRNGGLPEAVARPVRAEGGGRDFNDALAITPAEVIADWTESTDMPPHERILAIVESDDDEPAPSRTGEQGDRSAVHAPNASPRFGGSMSRKSTVANEQPWHRYCRYVSR